MGKSSENAGERGSCADAKRAILQSLQGPFHNFCRICGSLPVVYLIIGWIIHRSVIVAIGAFFFALFFHVFVTSYFATRAKVGIEHCPAKSAGNRWARIFIYRTIAHHLIMMSILIWLDWVWFLVAGMVIYVIETIVTLATLRQQGCLADDDLHILKSTGASEEK